MGILMGVIAYLISPTLLAWLSPTLVALLLAVPLSKLSGSVAVGKVFHGSASCVRRKKSTHRR